MTKYIFITGGVISSLGKGIAAASLGSILESRDIDLTFMKCDPYINVDPGTMNPYEHGEVFVTDDGAETDLDLGYYERFTKLKMGKKNNITTGQIYSSVIQNERKGLYLGSTVQVIPHITDQIKSCIINNTMGHEIAIVEIGGTIGDIESLPFLESIRQIKIEKPQGSVIFIHLTFVPYLDYTNEIKTKPTQHSVKELRSIGIQPDILICRSKKIISKKNIKKISLFTNVEEKSVISSPNLKSIYDLPSILSKQNLDDIILNKFKMLKKKPNFDFWKKFTKENTELQEINIAIIGKYVSSPDSYKSLNEALHNASIYKKVKLNIEHFDSEFFGKEDTKLLSNKDGILIPGGFGTRGIDGKIIAVEYARENKIPFLGICLGLQVAIIEFCKNVLNIKEANSREFDKETKFPIIDLIKEWNHSNYGIVKRDSNDDLGGSMRLGSYKCFLEEGSLAKKIYQKKFIEERHRHRYEVNAKLIGQISNKGLNISGKSDNGKLVEIIEYENHPWFISCQFHPEFNSKPNTPHPLFLSYIEAVKKNKR